MVLKDIFLSWIAQNRKYFSGLRQIKEAEKQAKCLSQRLITEAGAHGVHGSYKIQNQA